jgi:hypothetical protein
LSDPNLLEIFTLLNKGIYEFFITKTVEEGRRHWFMNQTKYISMSLHECYNDLDGNGSIIYESGAMLNKNGDNRKGTFKSPNQRNSVFMSPGMEDPQQKDKESSCYASNKGVQSRQEEKVLSPDEINIACTPGIFAEIEKQRNKGDQSTKKPTESPLKQKTIGKLYAPNPLQQFEIMAEDNKQMSGPLVLGQDTQTANPSKFIPPRAASVPMGEQHRPKNGLHMKLHVQSTAVPQRNSMEITQTTLTKNHPQSAGSPQRLQIMNENIKEGRFEFNLRIRVRGFVPQQYRRGRQDSQGT